MAGLYIPQDFQDIREFLSSSADNKLIQEGSETNSDRCLKVMVKGSKNSATPIDVNPLYRLLVEMPS